MALIPDEAIESMTELSAGAWRLYCYLARRRNHTTGQCNPSLTTCAEAIGVHPKNIFKLRRELSIRGWAMFNGDNVLHLAWLTGSKNATREPEKEGQLVAKTLLESSKNATIESQKRYHRVARTLPNGSKNATPYKEEPAKEPAKREREQVSPIGKPAEGARALSLVEKFSATAISLAKVCNLHPDTLTDKQVQDLVRSAGRLDSARGFDRAMLDRFTDYWNNQLRKSHVPVRPEYVLEHFGGFLTWAKGAAA